MNTLRVGKDEFELPSNWGEASDKQFLIYAKLRSVCGKDDMRLLRLLVFRWSGMPVKTYMLMNNVQITNVAQALDWVFTSPPPSINMLPVIKVNGVELYGQGDDFKHVIVEEWMCADPEVKKFVNEQSDEALDRLICFMYRPKGKNVTESGDKREEFNEYRCLDRMKLVKQITAWEKLAISVNYMGMRSKLVNDFKHVFKGGGSGKSFGIPGMIHDLAGAELGTVKDIEKKWTIRNLCFIIQKNEIRRLEAAASKTT